MKLVAYWIVLEWQKHLASGFLGGPDGEESAWNGGDPGSIPGMEPIPVFLPGESPWTEEPGLLQFMGSQRVGHNWATRKKEYD